MPALTRKPLSESRPENKTFLPQGNGLKVFESARLIECAVGPTRTGKTRAWLEKAHFACSKFPGTRILFARQTKHSMGETILQTWEDEVLPSGYCKPSSASRSHRQTYEYLNGSTVVITGLDDLTKLLSGEYDMILVFQAEECLEETIMGLTTRLSGEKLGFVQLGMDVNPRGRSHWIKQKIDSGDIHCLNFTFEDNPRWFDKETGEYTPQGRAYIDNLDKTLTGHQKERLLKGKWANPEGARFKTADRNKQGFTTSTVFPQGLPGHWMRWLSVDYGHANPYSVHWHAGDEHEGVWTYLEDYGPGFEADEQAARIVALSPDEETYYAIYLDPSMFIKHTTFGAKATVGGEMKPAADQYREVFDAENKRLGREKFGPLMPGAPNTREEGFVTLDSLLRQGRWKVERGCTNLWRELEDAVYYKDPRTGIAIELINPNGGNYSSDHALEDCVRGLHKRRPVTDEPAEDRLPTADELAAERMREYREALDERMANAGAGRELY